jgi:hypothetical protein
VIYDFSVKPHQRYSEKVWPYQIFTSSFFLTERQDHHPTRHGHYTGRSGFYERKLIKSPLHL